MFRSTAAAVMRPKRAFIALAVALYGLVPFVIATVLATGAYPLLAMCIHSLLLGSMSLAYGLRSTRRARFDEGTLTVDGDALTLEGRTFARRSDLTQAFVVPSTEGTLVRLDRRTRLRPPLFVRVRDPLEAAALLDELGFDAAHTAAEMRIASAVLGMSLGRQLLLAMGPILLVTAAIVALASQAAHPMIVLPLVAVLFAYVFTLAFAPMRVRIGTDGIVTHWLGRARFIPHGAIVKIAIYKEYIGGKEQRGVQVLLTSGAEVKLPTGQTDVGDVEATRLAQRIEEAREAHGRGAAGGTTDLLARGERSALEWVRLLRGVGAQVVGPRTPAVPSEVLLRVVEDTKGDPVERASAAVAALAASDADDEAARQRVRVAANTTASPALRIALDRIVAPSADEAELADALDQLDPGRRTRGS